jgi:electron transfer flavoprotein alpha subunit
LKQEVEHAPAAGMVEPLCVTFSEMVQGTRIVSRTPREASGHPELTEAAIVVAGGWGPRSPSR